MKKSRPLTSFIIVNYNAGRHLVQSVKSAAQIPNCDVIVVDNASSDDSLAHVQKLSMTNIQTIKNFSNLGFARGVNQAVAASTGECIFLLNPDAVVNEKALRRLLETLHEYNDRAIVAPRLINADGSPQPSCYHRQSIGNAVREYIGGQKGRYGKYLPAQAGLTAQASLPAQNIPSQVDVAVAAAWIVPRKVWDELGGLNEKFFLYFEDLDFCDRAQSRDIPVVYDPRASVVHHHGISAGTNDKTGKLFLQSAVLYHGRVKKMIIDTIIRLHNLWTPPVTPKKVCAHILGYTALIFGIMTAGYFILPARLGPLPFLSDAVKSNFLLWSWANFDGEHYVRIASYGYQTIAGQSQYAFFPLYPALINLVSRMGIGTYLAAHFVTAVSFVGLIFAFTTWVKERVKNPITILWLLLLSPGAIYLSALYTEPLFLLLTVLTFIESEKREWGKATFFSALATATRINGIFLVAYLIVKMLRSKMSVLKTGLYSLGASGGLIAYMTFLYAKADDPLAFFHAQSGWAKSTATWPWVTAGNYLRALTTEFVPDMTHLTVSIEVIVTVTVIYLFVKLWQSKKLDAAYLAYCGGNVLLPLATGSLGSMPRFSLVAFPLLLVVPSFSRRVRTIFYIVSSILFVIGTILFTRGYWYA